MCFCVGWLFYHSLSRLGSLAFSMHQKVPTSQLPVSQVCAEFNVVWQWCSQNEAKEMPWSPPQ